MRLPMTLVAMAATLTAVAVLTGCGDETSRPETETTVSSTPSSTRSMEEALRDAADLQSEIEQALADKLGPRDWAPLPNSSGITRSVCPDGESEMVQLPARGFTGVYDTSDWDQVVAIVTEHARAHGLDQVKTVVDEPDERQVSARADDGSVLSLGWQQNTSLAIRVGCHRWAGTPYPGGQPLPPG